MNTRATALARRAEEWRTHLAAHDPALATPEFCAELAHDDEALAGDRQTRRFLDALFADMPGRIELRAFDPRTGNPLRLGDARFHGEWPGAADPASATRTVARLRDRATIFVGTATRDAQGKGGKANVVATRVLFVDIDAPAAFAALPERLKNLEPPTFIVRTSAQKAHLYWRLNEAFVFEGPSDMQRYKRLLLGLADRWGGDRAVVDVARVLRVPGSWNWKTDPPWAVAFDGGKR